MKINELKTIFSTAVPLLEVKYLEKTVSKNAVSSFTELNNYRLAVVEIESTGLLSKEIQVIMKTAIFTTAKDDFEINLPEGRRLNIIFSNFLNLCVSLNQSFHLIGGEPNPNSVSIRLPDVKDFEDLAKASTSFHKILSQSILDNEIKGNVQIDNVENGSIWLTISVGTAAAVNLIGGLAWAAAVVYKKYQEGKVFEEYARGIGIKNDGLKELQLLQKNALDQLIQVEADNLGNEHYKEEKSEKIERLKHTIKLLSELLLKGAEVHPALNQPENVKNLFPDMKKLNLLESKIKKLEVGE